MGDNRVLDYGGDPADRLVRVGLTTMRDLASIQARGELVRSIAELLEDAGIQSAEEFGNLLGLFSVIVAEDGGEEGDILAYWASLVRDETQPSVDQLPA